MLNSTKYNIICLFNKDNNESTETFFLESHKKSHLLITKIISIFELEDDFKVIYLDEDITQKLNDKSNSISSIFENKTDIVLNISIKQQEKQNLNINPKLQKLIDEINSFLKDNAQVSKDDIEQIFQRFLSELLRNYESNLSFLKDFLLKNVTSHNNSIISLKDIVSTIDHNSDETRIYKQLVNFKYIDTNHLNKLFNSIIDNTSKNSKNYLSSSKDILNLSFKPLPMIQLSNVFKVSTFSDIENSISQFSFKNVDEIHKFLYFPNSFTENEFMCEFEFYCEKYLKNVNYIELYELKDFDENKKKVLDILLNVILEKNTYVLEGFKFMNIPSKFNFDKFLKQIGEVKYLEIANSGNPISSYLSHLYSLESFTLLNDNESNNTILSVLEKNKNTLKILNLKLKNICNNNKMEINFTNLKNLTSLTLDIIDPMDIYYLNSKFQINDYSIINEENINIKDIEISLSVYEKFLFEGHTSSSNINYKCYYFSTIPNQLKQHLNNMFFLSKAILPNLERFKITLKKMTKDLKLRTRDDRNNNTSDITISSGEQDWNSLIKISDFNVFHTLLFNFLKNQPNIVSISLDLDESNITNNQSYVKDINFFNFNLKEFSYKSNSLFIHNLIIKNLSTLNKLERLKLTDFNKSIFRSEFTFSENLKELDIECTYSNNNFISRDKVLDILSKYQNLEKLTIKTYSDFFEKKEYFEMFFSKYIKSSKNLKFLHLKDINILDRDSFFEGISGLSNVEIIIIDNLQNIDDLFFKDFFVALENLKLSELIVNNNFNVNNSISMKVVGSINKCKYLKKIALNSYTPQSNLEKYLKDSLIDKSIEISLNRKILLLN